MCLCVRARARSWNPLGPASAHSLGMCLKHNRCDLVHLDLSNTSIGDEGARFLGKALESNTVLRVLRVCTAELGEDGAAALAVAITHNTALREFAISGAVLRPTSGGGARVCPSPNTHCAGNLVGDVGSSAFWELFEGNHTLQRLEMSGCRITDFGAKILSENMVFSHTVKYLDFSFNFVRCSPSLPPSPFTASFERCVFAQLQISKAVLVEMATAVQSMPQLDILYVAANELTREEFREFVKDKPDLLALTQGVSPRVRFTLFPK